MKKLLKWILPMVIVAAAIPVFPSLKAEVEPVKVEAKKVIYEIGRAHV